jgi:hypothetical protein
VRRRAVVEGDHRPVARSRDGLRNAYQYCRRRIELEWKSVHDGHVHPDDVVVMVNFSCVVVVRFVLMRLEMTVDDCVRVVGVGFVGVQRRKP